MANHHPPRHCFEALDWDDANLVCHAHFTEDRKIATPKDELWDFNAATVGSYNTFKANPTGVFFNANVRDSANWTAVRIS